MEHSFTEIVKNILKIHFKSEFENIYEKSYLLQYINQKTRAAEKGSKSRSSYANLYALYVLIEDYVSNGFDTNSLYSKYEGSLFSSLFTRQRELPFGAKLQNHALNNRVNSEFQKFFPNIEYIPILRNLETKRYWINENLLNIRIKKKNYNIARAFLEIIDKYMQIRQGLHTQFVNTCRELKDICEKSPQQAESFILDLLHPSVDARIFEIVSYSILKFYYIGYTIIWGFEMSKLNSDNLKLYKTGRTNANDGGIDFVMKPLGRFFQVTENTDFKKYFLDIDKIQKYPITFVVKSTENIEDILNKIRINARKSYSIDLIVERYMECIEEVINIPVLKTRLNETILSGRLKDILDEIIMQSNLEFNYE